MVHKNKRRNGRNAQSPNSLLPLLWVLGLGVDVICAPESTHDFLHLRFSYEMQFSSPVTLLLGKSVLLPVEQRKAYPLSEVMFAKFDYNLVFNPKKNENK